MKSQLQQVNQKIKGALSHQGFRKYFFNAGWMFTEKVIRLIVAVFISAYVARYLGPGQFGLLNYSISLVGLSTVFSGLGLNSILVRELVKNEKKKDVLLGTAFMLRAASAAIVFLILIILVESTETDRTTRILIYIIASCSVFHLFDIINLFFQAKVWSKYMVWSQLYGLVGTSVFKIILILNGATLEWFAASYVLDVFIIAFGLIYFYQKNAFGLLNWKFDFKIAKELLSSSWPLIFSSLAITIYMKFDQLMIKWMLGNEANGNYGVAVRLTEMWGFIPGAVVSSVFPALLNAKTNSEALYLKRIQNLHDLVVGMALSIAIPMTFLSGFIVHILFGQAYSEGGDVLSLYIWACVFTFLGTASSRWIVIENLQAFKMYWLVTAGILNVILNYILIKLIGLNGAAISTLISYSVADYFSLLWLRRTRPMFISMTKSFNIFRLFQQLVKGGTNF